ncbi:hypothetical protein, partial [Lewinella sp. IMCC34191]|uniref:hypothetical protein n=1 Tax=Lewinella sp. IMCC34191 TaxID=2259172 RepID=UPI001E3799D4
TIASAPCAPQKGAWTSDAVLGAVQWCFYFFILCSAESLNDPAAADKIKTSPLRKSLVVGFPPTQELF